MPDGPATVEMMADDAAAVLRALDIPSAHVAGFSGGSIISQELALRHPDLRPQPRAAEHLGRDGHLPAQVGDVHPVAGGCRSERTGLPRGLLPGDLHPAGAQRRHGRRDHRRGAGVPLQAVPRGHPADAGRLHGPPDHRPAAPDLRADPGAGRQHRRHGAPSAGTCGRRRDPRRAVRGRGRRVPRAVPGGPGPVERAGRRVLAGRRDASRFRTAAEGGPGPRADDRPAGGTTS